MKLYLNFTYKDGEQEMGTVRCGGEQNLSKTLALESWHCAPHWAEVESWLSLLLLQNLQPSLPLPNSQSVLLMENLSWEWITKNSVQNTVASAPVVPDKLGFRCLVEYRLIFFFLWNQKRAVHIFSWVNSPFLEILASQSVEHS